MYFTKKPVTIEAMQLTEENVAALCEWCGGKIKSHPWTGVVIETLEGNMLASKGDWIIKGIQGEFYPCKPDIFEQSYHAADAPIAQIASNFQMALFALKAGRKVARSGWNGKGMFVVLQKGYPDGIKINANTAEALGIEEGTVKKFLPYLMFQTAQGDFVPWLASQTDLLADDWEVV